MPVEPLVVASRKLSFESEPSLSSPSDTTLAFETPLVTETRQTRLLNRRMDAFNANRPGVTVIEIGSLKAKVTRQLGVFEKRRASIVETMDAIREQLEIDEFSKEFEKLRLDFDVLTTAVKIINENLTLGDQRCAALAETDKPRVSWEEYRIEKQDVLCELEELHLMVKLTLDRTVERSTARRSASRYDTRPRPISSRMQTDRQEDRQQSSRTNVPQLESGGSGLSNLQSMRRELEESFEQYETVGSRAISGNSGPPPAQFVPTFDVRLDKGHFKLTLPIFDGQHWEWDRFWSQFELHIDNQNYPDSVKLNILRAHLAGEALDILDTGSQDGTDFEGGKAALKFHYDNESVKKASILAKIEGIPRASNLSPNLSKTFTELKKLIKGLQRYEDVNTAHMRRTIRMKLPREAVVDLKQREDLVGHEWTTDELLCALENYIGTRRLDETYGEYEKVRVSTKVVDEFKGESGRNLSSSFRNSNISRNSLRFNSASAPTDCVLCGLSNHKAEFCRKTSIEEAESVVRQKQLCRKCLKPGHRAARCSADPCNNCGGAHSAKLCQVRRGSHGPAGGNNFSGTNPGQTASNSPNGKREGSGLNYQANSKGSGKNWNAGNNSNNSQTSGSRGQESFRTQ